MTPEERAGNLIRFNGTIFNTEFGVNLIAAAIREAVLAEREACAVICDEISSHYGYGDIGPGPRIGEAIRGRDAP